MDRTWPPDASTFARATRDALSRLGGVDFARRAEADPALRVTQLQPVLHELGLLELAPATGPIELQAAALAVREAGAVVCPWPLVQQLSVGPDLAETTDAVFLADRPPSRLEHLDLVTSPIAVSYDGRAWRPVVAAGAGVTPSRIDPFGVPCAATDVWSEAGRYEVTLHSVLNAFWVLGALTSVVDLSSAYAAQRRQFGRTIGQFGSVRWRLADMAVLRTGLEELCNYTLWRLLEANATIADALALRTYQLDAAHGVLENAHVLFAAIGLCDEHDLSVIDRHVQPLLRRPMGLADTLDLLATQVAAEGFDALFSVAPSDRQPAGQPAARLV
jgi:acyl-CoA dehydrogenase